ncbi:serine/threonine-protein kinase [Streptomyces sp. NPDC093252]|uniref:serine/threonine-protein kinase n=1 Tax=Streptomyces sp. NPDC093252 TaxID=3154980 RepID=UPI003443E2CE
MGTVWRARDEKLLREIAVKEVRPPAGLTGPNLDRMYRRLEREAWAAARISDPTVVTVHDVAVDDGRPWIVMELVRGRSLGELLRSQGPITPSRAAHIGAEVLGALRAAHAVGVEHRDVKPANVLLADDGRVVLSDFGIATVEGSTQLTLTGELVGSPEYLPPERALGRASGPESDLWSLGVLLYTAVEGTSPFRRATPLDTLRAVVDSDLPAPRRAGPLAPVIEGLLHKDPARRLPADQLARALRELAGDGTTLGTPLLTDAPTLDDLPTGPGGDDEATVTETETESVLAPPVGATSSGAQGSTRDATTTRTPPTPPAPAPAPAPTPAATLTSPPPPRPPRSPRPRILALITTVALLLAAAAAYALLELTENDDEPEATPETGITATVTGTRTTYTGACAPPADLAPTFTVTFTAPEPAQVSYRWLSEDGSVVDPGWRVLTLDAGADGTGTGQNTVRLTAYSGAGTLESRIGVEVRQPDATTSNAVPFSVTCTN